MNERASIGKSVRFKVFKRDAFSCQYCGATPPSVVLEIDHIHPVSKGGKNSLDNLITACFSCNRGKSAGLLSDVPKSILDKATEIKEREAQLKGYTKILQDKADRIERECWAVAAAIEGVENVDSYNRKDLASIRRFLEDLSVVEVIYAAEVALAKFPYKTSKTFRYFCGVCWKMIRDQSDA